MNHIQLDQKLLEEMTAFRRWMHQHPELSEQEKETSKEICRILTKYHIDYHDHVGGYGVVAVVFGADEGRTVAAKTDIDALPILENTDLPFASVKPGIMHACGHDANTAILLGTAIYLKQTATQWSGSVKFFFEPAEETVGGGELMVQDGCMENPPVHDIIGLHVMPYLNVGTIEIKKGCLNAGSDEIEITVKGKGGHAAEPETCVDPIVALSYIITALQTFVSRNTAPTHSAVLTFGVLHAGTKGNIIPDTAFAKGTLRTLLPTQRQNARNRIIQIAQSVAKGFGATAEVKIIESYDAVINDDKITDIIAEEGRALFGDQAVVQKTEPSMGAEDFSYYTKKASGAYFHIGCKDPAQEEIVNLHTDRFQLDERSIQYGIQIQSAVLLKLLAQKS